MKSATPNIKRPGESEPFTPAILRDRVSRISSNWSPEERELRALEGAIRRERLFATIGLDTQKACA